MHLEIYPVFFCYCSKKTLLTLFCTQFKYIIYFLLWKWCYYDVHETVATHLMCYRACRCFCDSITGTKATQILFMLEEKQGKHTLIIDIRYSVLATWQQKVSPTVCTYCVSKLHVVNVSSQGGHTLKRERSYTYVAVDRICPYREWFTGLLAHVKLLPWM